MKLVKAANELQEAIFTMLPNYKRPIKAVYIAFEQEQSLMPSVQKPVFKDTHEHIDVIRCPFCTYCCSVNLKVMLIIKLELVRAKD